MTLDGLERALRSTLMAALLSDAKHGRLSTEELPVTEVPLVGLCDRMVDGDPEAVDEAVAQGLVRVTHRKPMPGHPGRIHFRCECLCPAFGAVLVHETKAAMYRVHTRGKRGERHAAVLNRWPVLGW